MIEKIFIEPDRSEPEAIEAVLDTAGIHHERKEELVVALVEDSLNPMARVLRLFNANGISCLCSDYFV